MLPHVQGCCRQDLRWPPTPGDPGHATWHHHSDLQPMAARYPQKGAIHWPRQAAQRSSRADHLAGRRGGCCRCLHPATSVQGPEGVACAPRRATHLATPQHTGHGARSPRRWESSCRRLGPQAHGGAYSPGCTRPAALDPRPPRLPDRVRSSAAHRLFVRTPLQRRGLHEGQSVATPPSAGPTATPPRLANQPRLPWRWFGAKARG